MAGERQAVQTRDRLHAGHLYVYCIEKQLLCQVERRNDLCSGGLLRYHWRTEVFLISSASHPGRLNHRGPEA